MPDQETTVTGPADRGDDDPITLPRWVVGLLAEELDMRTDCGGDNYEEGCPRCDAWKIAQEAYENG